MNKKECLIILERIRINWGWAVAKDIPFNSVINEMMRLFSQMPFFVVNSTIDELIFNGSDKPTFPKIYAECRKLYSNKLNEVDMAGGLTKDELLEMEVLHPIQQCVKKQIVMNPSMPLNTLKAWAIKDVMKLGNKVEVLEAAISFNKNKPSLH